MRASSSVLLQHVTDDLASYFSEAPEMSAKSFACNALRSSLLKKFVGEEFSSAKADSLALQKFLKVNEELLDTPRPAVTLLDQHLLGELKSSLDRFWFKQGDVPLVSGLYDLYLNGRVGPGASLGITGNDFYTKLFSSRLTTTSSLLYDSYRAACDRTPLTSDAEKFRSEAWGTCDVVSASKLLFVPKSNVISRTICVEPSLNMFYQLGLGRIIEERLQQVFHLDLATQPDFNRELARRGSVDGSFATIDLSSASDSLSRGVLKEILPRGFYSWLVSLATPNVKLPDGRVVALKMISTMGNGFTFPLETVIFTAVVAAAYRVNGTPLLLNRGGDVGNFAVFGDDIIIETSIASKVMRLLWLLGFTPNLAKTFIEGPFRESCGSDWFEGRNVRGVYIKSLHTPQDRYVAINLLNEWSACTRIPLCETIAYLASTVKRVLVPPFEALEAGIHVPLWLASPRFNRNGAFRYQAYKPQGRFATFGEDGRSKLDVGREPNKPGLELTFIAGYIRSGRLSLRQRLIRFQKKTLISPIWDLISAERSRGRFGYKRWEAAVSTNLACSEVK